MRWVLLLLLLSGCTGQSDVEHALHNYAKRVADVLQQPLPTLSIRPLPPLPAQRIRRIEIPALRESIWQVLDFGYCNLLPLIAERNSSLGKLAQPSQQFIYEVRFLQQLGACLPTLHNHSDIRPEQREHLQQIYQHKRAYLPATLWNGLYSGAEIQQSLAANQPPLPLTVTLSDYSDVLASERQLTRLAKLSQTAPEKLTVADVRNLEAQLAIIYHKPLGTPLLNTLRTLEATLRQVSQMIEQRLDRRPVCFNQTPTARAEHIKAVFLRYYITTLQPHLAQVDNLAQQWLTLQQRRLDYLPVPVAFQHYAASVLSRQSTSMWQRYQQARNRHTRAWQQLFNQCQMMPGQQYSITPHPSYTPNNE